MQTCKMAAKHQSAEQASPIHRLRHHKAGTDAAAEMVPATGVRRAQNQHVELGRSGLDLAWHHRGITEVSENVGDSIFAAAALPYGPLR
mmetsp:Transcript_70608/g.197248  ORF Transcript_70608/g.197248 Transcript_70608/m.197248 type:complete len:89 (+) Transcript_70608:136-402(+)